MTGIPRRRICDNLKKFKLQGNLTRKEGRAEELNSIQMTTEDYHF